MEEPEYTDVGVLTRDNIQIVLRVHDPQSQEQTEEVMKAVIFGIAEVYGLDELMALRRMAAAVLDQYRKDHPDANRQEL